MSVSQQSNERSHSRDEGLVALSILGLVVATVLMGWCLFGHERPNMPGPIVMQDAGTPR